VARAGGMGGGRGRACASKSMLLWWRCLERGDVASCKHRGGALRQSTAAALRRAPHRAVRHCVITPRWRRGHPERYRPVMGAPCRVPSDGSVTELLRARLASGPPSLLTVPQTPVGSRPTMARPPTHGAQRISSIPAGQMIKPGCVTSFSRAASRDTPAIFTPQCMCLKIEAVELFSPSRRSGAETAYMYEGSPKSFQQIQKSLIAI